MGPDDGGVDEGACLIDFDGELLEEGFPPAALRPAAEPVVHGLPRAEALGQVPPRNAGPDSPDDRVDEVAVTTFGDRARPRLEHCLDSLPLCISQFVSVHGQC